MLIAPRRWNEFQHYKDRNPTWIKLHRALLDDYEYQCLPVASRALAPMLWLLASEHKDGVIDAEAGKLAFRLRMTPKEVDQALTPLIEKGFFEVVQDASKPLAEPERAASPETERETERERETTLSGKPDVEVPKVVAKRVLAFLNEKTSRAYQPVDANLEFIVARLKEGATEGQLRQVVAKKCREWGADEKMSGYLRPATLFNRTKFAQYVGELT